MVHDKGKTIPEQNCFPFFMVSFYKDMTGSGK